MPLPEGKEVFGSGGAAICEPDDGEVIAGPLYGEEGIVIADCDLRVALHAKRWFDAVGHYSREDVLATWLAATRRRPSEPIAPSPRRLSRGRLRPRQPHRRRRPNPRIRRPVRYPVETFTPAEQALLAPHFTNLDRPGLLPRQPARRRSRARCSPATRATRARCGGCSWRSSPATSRAGERPFDGVEGERAAGLYERVFIGYGDDSIAQVGGAHVACEWVSNVLTKILQRGRLAAYLEQSTRYIPYDQPIAGTRRLPLLLATTSSARAYRAAMDELFGIYSRGLETVPGLGRRALAARRRSPRRAWRRSIRAKALDLLRGLLPAVDPQPRRHLRLRPGLRAAPAAPRWPRPLPEARDYGEMILAELGKVIPSFVARVDRPDRGGDWIDLPARAAARPTERAVARLGLDRREGEPTRRRSSWSTSTAARRTCSPPSLFESAGACRGARSGAGSRPSTRSSARS